VRSTDSAGVVERHRQFFDCELIADIGQIRTFDFPASRDHVTRRALAGVEEETLSGGRVAGRLSLRRWNIQRAHPLGERPQFGLRQGKRGHPARRTIPDQVVDLILATGSQAAVILERRRPVAAPRSFSVTCCALAVE